MEWITKIDIKNKSYSYKETLTNAINQIKEWCELNEYEFDLSHNTSVHHHDSEGNGWIRNNANRCITIKTPNSKYIYKLTISSYYEVIGQKEVRIPNYNIFNWDPDGTSATKLENVYDDKLTYYAWLKRF